MIRVYTCGVFDLFHVGHLRALQKAKSLGDWLLVGVHDDKDVATYKRTPIIPVQDRVEIVRHMECVDEVLFAAPLAVDREFYEKHNIDIHCQGVDTPPYYDTGIRLGMVRFVGRDPRIDSSRIIDAIVARHSVGRTT